MCKEKECAGTEHDKNYCKVEKMGCRGCYYLKEVKNDESKTSECTDNKSDKTD